MDQCKQIIQKGLVELGIDYEESQLEQLLAFIQLIEKWNKAYNLTSVRNRHDMARLHILDSLAILPFIEGKEVADIGTGAGIPGIPLAIFLPEVGFTLLDSNSKKTRFVQQVILELKLKNVKVVHSRVENLKPESPFSSVIMRAFTNLPDIVTLTQHLINDHGVLLAMKGHKPEDELLKLEQPYSVVDIQVPEIEAERCLIRIGGANNG